MRRQWCALSFDLRRHGKLPDPADGQEQLTLASVITEKSGLLIECPPCSPVNFYFDFFACQNY